MEGLAPLPPTQAAQCKGLFVISSIASGTVSVYRVICRFCYPTLHDSCLVSLNAGKSIVALLSLPRERRGDIIVDIILHG